MEGMYIDNQAVSLEQTIRDGCGVAENGCLRYFCPDDRHQIVVTELSGDQWVLVVCERCGLDKWQSIGEMVGTLEQVSFMLLWCRLFDRAQGYWYAY